MQRLVPTTAHGGRLTNTMNDQLFDALADERHRTLLLDLLEWVDDHADVADQHGQFEL